MQTESKREPAAKPSKVALVLCLVLAGATSGKETATVDAPLAALLCQVVYPFDRSSEEGHRYVFFGNGFFISKEGYLTTAAHLPSSYFRNRGEPYILVGPREAPPRMLAAPTIDADWDHDVPVQRAGPNPFHCQTEIAHLPLSAETPARGDRVLAAALRPPDVEKPHSLAAPLEDFSQGKAIDYQCYRKKGAGERELLLFDQEVLAGQSGAPLVSAPTHAVAGVIVGRWMHPNAVPAGLNEGHLTLAPGAALRIHYGIALLQRQHIECKMASEPSYYAASAGQQAGTFQAPTPVSVVAAPYPPQALFGGDVLLDALVDATGKVTDVKVVTGDPPFLESVLTAVRTWSFVPARRKGNAVDARVGIVFEYPQSFLPRLRSNEHKHAGLLTNSGDRAALPVLTVEPDYPTTSIAEGNIILYGLVDSDGQLRSTSVLRNVESLTDPTLAAVHRWQFEPGRHAGAKTDATVVVVVTFRRPAR